MNLPIRNDERSGKFTATVLDSTQLKASGDTRDDAIRAVSQLVQIYLRRGTLVFVDVPQPLVMSVPRRELTPEQMEAWDEVVEEAYRYRDELKAQEFSE